MQSSVIDTNTQARNATSPCAHCNVCTARCEVLEGPGLDVGRVMDEYSAIIALPEADRPAAAAARMQAEPALYNALRQCCFCNYCTSRCPSHILAAAEMRGWRELFSKANLMPPADSRIVMVDNEWHIFSAYRAIYGVAYPDFTTLDAAAAAPGTCDTLFFPGCSLVSYGKNVMDAVGAWLDASGVAWCYTDDCCGSPLMSAGLFDRAAAFRARIADRIAAAGIKRVLTVCPGCADELRADMPQGVELVPMPEFMLQVADMRIQQATTNEADTQAGEGAVPADSTQSASTAPNPAIAAAGFSPLADVPSVTFFDSCHDRADNRNARAIRELVARFMPQVAQVEIAHSGKDNLCCGAGGAVSAYDPDITSRRIGRVVAETSATGAAAAITACPTCSYTFAQELLRDPHPGFEALHYLELMFGTRIDWARVFDELASMWTGEYAAWLMQTFYS